MKEVNTLVLGGGAAGLSCAAQIGEGCTVLEHNKKPGLKILISGGGRCNFTNLHVSDQNYISSNPHFVKSALSRFTPQDTVNWVNAAGIPWHEKHRGQLFCDTSSKEILDLLLDDCQKSGATVVSGRRVGEVTHDGLHFVAGDYRARHLVVATGGISYPRLGVSDLGYTIAQHFGHTLTDLSPSLVGLKHTKKLRAQLAELSGISLPVRVSVNQQSFDEDLLFTHDGLSGPAILQISNYWKPGTPLKIDLLPQTRLEEWLQKNDTRDKKLLNALSAHMPRRLVQLILDELDLKQHKVKQLQDADLQQLSKRIHDWQLAPAATTGYDKAEVTRGGVDTQNISSKTFESQLQPGLYFIGEVLDVTGWLGGYNFQWAFASGRACGQAISSSKN